MASYSRLVAVAALAAAHVDHLPTSPGHVFRLNNSESTPYRRKAAVFASVSDAAIVLFGGKGKDSRLNGGHMAYVGDTWHLGFARNGATWTRLRFPGGDGGDNRPGPRWKSAGDGLGGALYLFGGHVERGTKSVFYDDLWRLDGLQGVAASASAPAWTRVRPVDGTKSPWPSERRGHAVAASKTTNALVLVGGRRAHKTCLRDAWVYDANASNWREVRVPPAAAGYGCRWGHTATAVEAQGANAGFLAAETIAVFGGRHKEADGGYDYLGGDRHSVWLYAPAADAWLELAAATDAGPAARDHHAAAYLGGGLYVTGGKTTNLAASAEADVWRYDLSTRTWTDLTEGAQPLSRCLHSAATWYGAPPVRVDGEPGAVVLFGGEHIKSRHRKKKKYVRLNDVWGYWPDANRPATRPGDWVVLIDDDGATAALNLSPFALHSVKIATAAVVVVVTLSVIAVAIYYRLGFHFPPDPYYAAGPHV